MTTMLLVLAGLAIAVLSIRLLVDRGHRDAFGRDLDDLARAAHDRHCRTGDWPHEGDCVAFEGYEAVANPLLTTLAERGYARRADVPELPPDGRAW